MVHEMYLQKCVQYVGGKCIGCDQQESLYKGIVVSMREGIKQYISIVIKGCLEVTIRSNWLAKEIADCIQQLSLHGFNV